MSDSTLLLVEDDLLVRTPLAAYLRECGYQVYEALNGAETRQLLGESDKQVDIVLASVTLPDETGFALARWIRATYPEIQVLLAGSVEMATEKAHDLCEEAAPVTKPYHHQTVLDHIKRLLAARARAKGIE